MGLISRVSSRTYRNRKKTKKLIKMARQEVMTLKGSLAGHGGWVTQIATNPQFPDMLISSSRDKTLIIWQLNRDGEAYGHPMKRLKGHNHFVSAGRDKTIKLWNTLGELKWSQEGKNGHSEWVSSVQFSPTTQNPVIVSGSWDKTLKVWHLSNFGL